MADTPYLHDVHGSLKPRLRGIVHAWAVAPMVVAGLLLVALSPSRTARLTATVYVIAITGMLAASAVYHRVRVSQQVQKWLRRLDHSMIGVAVAGTYTPVIVLLVDGVFRTTLLTILWVGAAGSLLLSFAWPAAPRWLRAAVYIALGWGGAAITPWLWTNGGVLAFTFAILGAVLYTGGSVVYARKRPNPWPQSFGFHEVFHTLVVLAAISHFVAVSLVIAHAA